MVTTDVECEDNKSKLCGSGNQDAGYERFTLFIAVGCKLLWDIQGLQKVYINAGPFVASVNHFSGCS